MIVCTLHPSLDLRKGVLSKSILEEGGETIQQELRKFHERHGPARIGSVVRTSGGSLHCKYLFHLSLPTWRDDHGQVNKELAMHMQTHTGQHAHMCSHAYIQRHTHTHMHHACTHMHAYTYTHTHRVKMLELIHTQAYMHVIMCMQTYTLAHTHTRTHACTHMCACMHTHSALFDLSEGGLHF